VSSLKEFIVFVVRLYKRQTAYVFIIVDIGLVGALAFG